MYQNGLPYCRFGLFSSLFYGQHSESTFVSKNEGRHFLNTIRRLFDFYMQSPLRLSSIIYSATWLFKVVNAMSKIEKAEKYWNNIKEQQQKKAKRFYAYRRDIVTLDGSWKKRLVIEDPPRGS